MSQVGHDELLETARDCFYFVTKFFEPINASSTHIYHSALELCPTSSIVRRFYYERYSRIDRLPRVIVGILDSWDTTISNSSKADYQTCTWSPCGGFVAALTGNTIDIRNQLTLELLTTLQPTETTPLFVGPLAYSPDGRSLACASLAAIVIWDIQTGGVAKKIECGDTKLLSLAWSLDGRRIGTLEYRSHDTRGPGTYACGYNAASGTPLFIEAINSNHKPYLWAYNETFRVTTTERYPLDHARIQVEIKVQEVGPLLTSILTFIITTKAQVEDTSDDYTPESEVVSFSPTTYHVAVLVANELLIFQDRSPDPLLEEKGCFLFPRFSPDGTLFAASKKNDVYIWKNTSRHYIRWWEFRCQDWFDSQFSPNQSSPTLLGHSKNILQVRRLLELPTNPQTNPQQYTTISPSGNHIATAQQFERIVKIMDYHSPAPLRYIRTDMIVEGLLLTNNVLLVVGSDGIVAWLLTEEVASDGPGSRGLNRRDSIWTVSLTSPKHSNNPQAGLPSQPKFKLAFHVEGQTGVIEHENLGFLLYNTATGEHQFVQTPPLLNGPGLNIGEGLRGRHRRYCHNLPQHKAPPEGSWCSSEGWVRDPGGRCRLWLDVE